MKKSLFEIIGMATYKDVSHRDLNKGFTQPQTKIPSNNQILYNPKSADNHGINLSARHCTSMMGWQSRVYGELLRGNSIYVVAKPGAGKTTPVMCYWAQKMLGLNPTMEISDEATLFRNIEKLILTPENVPKTLFLVPVRALAELTYNEIISDYADIILQGMRAFIDKFWVDDLRFKNLIKAMLYNRQDGDRIEAEIEDLERKNKDLYDEYRVNGDQQIKNTFDNNVKILHNRIGILIRDFVESNLISQVSGTHSPDRGKIRSAPMIVAIYESGSSLIKNGSLNKDNLKLVFVDESHLTQAEVGNQNDTRADNIANGIYTIIKNVSEDTQFVFMSGTVNPNAARDFGDYLKTCFKRDLVILDDLNASGNASNVTVKADDRLQDKGFLLSLITNPPGNANLIILFSKKIIKGLVEDALKRLGRATPDQVNSGVYQAYDPRWQYGSINSRRDPPGYQQQHLSPLDRQKYEEMERNKTFFPSKEMKAAMTALPGVEEVTDPILLQCLLAGFGYTYRGEDTEDEDKLKEQAKNMQITTGLFSQGKIKTLLATDAVGIGVNLKVLKMYIPTINKFGGMQKGNQSLETGNAAQLFARVGRAAFPESTIYTATEFVPAIIGAMASNPEQFQKRVTVEKPSRAACQSTNYFLDLWHVVHGVF